MRRFGSHDRDALRPEFEELVELLELIGLLEMNVSVDPQPVFGRRPIRASKKAA